MSNPVCCGQPSTWIDQGPRLQYHFCKICKKEVTSIPAADKKDESEDDSFYPFHLQGTEPCYRDPAKKINYHYWIKIDSTTACNCGMIN